MKSLRAFTLIDILIGMILTSGLVILFTLFARDMYRYTAFIRNHQRLRTEAFALASVALPSLIREAVGIDYANTGANKLTLFMDKDENQTVTIVRQPTGNIDATRDIAQLFIQTGVTDQEPTTSYVLNSQATVIEDFKVEVSEQPRKTDKNILVTNRELQPMVRISLTTRRRRPEASAARTFFSFWEEPKISYVSFTTLRNYVSSNLRKKPL